MAIREKESACFVLFDCFFSFCMIFVFFSHFLSLIAPFHVQFFTKSGKISKKNVKMVVRAEKVSLLHLVMAVRETCSLVRTLDTDWM